MRPKYCGMLDGVGNNPVRPEWCSGDFRIRELPRGEWEVEPGGYCKVRPRPGPLVAAQREGGRVTGRDSAAATGSLRSVKMPPAGLQSVLRENEKSNVEICSTVRMKQKA